MKISTVITYSELDKNFIDFVIKESVKFSSEIIISYSYDWWDGEYQPHTYIKTLKEKYKGVKFVTYKYDGLLVGKRGTGIMGNISRLTGYKEISIDPDFVLFLDGDEIPDGKKIKETFFNKEHTHNSYYLWGYWYWREPIYQAKSTEVTSLLCKYPLEHQSSFFGANERRALMQSNHINLIDEPMIHHYSWVGNYKDLYTKISKWGHRNDRDWKKLLYEEFKHDFNGTDFVHGYKYNILDKPIHNIKIKNG